MKAAGDLRQRIEVQELRQGAATEYGTVQDEWTTICTRWCAIEPRGRVPGGEVFSGGQVSSEHTHKVTMRYWSDPNTGAVLTTKHRLKYGDRVFNIDAISNPGELANDTMIEVFVKEAAR